MNNKFAAGLNRRICCCFKADFIISHGFVKTKKYYSISVINYYLRKILTLPAFIILILLLIFITGLLNRADAQSLLNLTSEERNWLHNNTEKMTLFFNTEFPPIEFASETGSFIGMGADIISIIEDRLDVAFRKEPCPDWNRHLAALKSGECAIAPTIVRTPEREQYAFFTVPYATVPVVIITSRSIPGKLTLADLRGRRVGVVSGFATEKYMRDRAAYGFKLITVKNVSEGLQNVSFGQLDAFVENLAVAAYHIDKQGIPNLRVAGKTDYAFAWSVGVSRKYPLLYTSIQKALDTIQEKEIEDVRKRWISLDIETGISPESIFKLKLIGLSAALLMLSLTFITIFLKRRLHEKVVNLRESERRFKELSDLLPEAIFEADMNFNLTFVNQKAISLFNYNDDEIKKGLNCLDMVIPEDRKRAIENIKNRIMGYGTGAIEYTAKRRDGSTFPVLISSTAITQNGKHIGLRGLVVDISEQKKAEEERHSLEERLQRAEKMEALGVLSGGVAHDLNNVLGILIGYSELILHEIKEPSPIRSYASSIMDASQRAAAIVQDMLTLARRGIQEKLVISINTLVLNFLKAPELEAIIKYHPNVKVKTDLESELLPVLGASAQLNKTIMNLVSNAAEAMPKGGLVTIQTYNQYLDRPVRGYDEVSEGDYVVLSISDSGEGIKANDIKNIFEPFYTKKVMGRSGTGLGLAVVWGTVKDHNGYIDVQSEVGEGSTFTLYFPVTREELSVQTSRLDASEYMGSGESILVVDDVKGQRDLAADMLRRLNYNVSVASSGEEAVEYLKDNKADLMVLDMIMDPGMDGLDTYKNAIKINPHQKAIIVSGFSDTERVKEAQSLGAGQYVKKPYVLEKLGVTVKKGLNKK